MTGFVKLYAYATIGVVVIAGVGDLIQALILNYGFMAWGLVFLWWLMSVATIVVFVRNRVKPTLPIYYVGSFLFLRCVAALDGVTHVPDIGFWHHFFFRGNGQGLIGWVGELWIVSVILLSLKMLHSLSRNAGIETINPKV